MKISGQKKAVFRNAVSNKLRSSSGESIAETLVAVLIAAFALLMLAGTVNTSSNLILKSQDALSDYYDGNNILAEQSGEGTTYNIVISGEGGVSETKEASGYSWDSNIGKKKLVSYKYKE